MKQLIKAAFVIMLFTAITRVLGFVYRIFLADSIGAVGLGIYQIVTSVFYVLICLTSSGIPVTISRKSAVYIKNNDLNSHVDIVRAGIIFNLMLAVMLSLIIVVFKDSLKWLFADERCMTVLLVLIPAFIFSGIYSSCRGGLWGEKKFFLFSLTECVEELLLVAFGIIFLQFASQMFSKIMLACLAITLSYCIASIMSLIFFSRQKKIFSYRKGYLLPLIKSSTPITAIRLTSSVLNFLIAIIVPAKLMEYGMSSDNALANLGVLTGMTLPILFVPSLLVGVLALIIVPELSTDKNDELRLRNGIKYALTLCMGFACLFIPVFAILGQDICYLLFKNHFAGELLSAIAPVMIFMCLSQISTTVLNSLGYEIQTMRNFLIGASFLIASIWFLTKYFGIYSLIIGFSGNNIIQSALNLLSLKRKVNFKIKYLAIALTPIVTLIPALILTRYIANLCALFLPAFVTICICLLVNTLVFCTVVYIFNDKKIIKFLNSEKSVRHKAVKAG